MADLTLATHRREAIPDLPPAVRANRAMLALDLGTATGWALHGLDGLITSGTASFRPGRFDGGGMRFEVVEPFRTLTVTFEGKVCLLTNPQDMADPSTAFRNNPSVPSSVRLTFTGISPMFGGEPVNDDGSPIEQKADEGFARGHYEQHMRGTGEIRVGDETFTIDGLGLRDHSWGPRFWQSIYWYRWLPMVFDESFAMMVSIVCRRPGEMHAGGMVLRDGEYVMIREATVTADYDDNQNQTTMRITARTDEIATLMTLEMGKVLAESKGEVKYGSEFFRWFAEEAVRIGGRYTQAPAGTGRIMVTKAPVGPCYAVTPWNFPLAMGTRKIGPALAAGCTMSGKVR